MIKKLFNLPLHYYILSYMLFFIPLSFISIFLQMTGKVTIRPDNFLFDNEMWSTLHGYGLFTYSLNHYGLAGLPSASFSEWGWHFTPFMLLVYCVYYFLPSIFTLYAMRVIALGLAAIPLYLIGKELVDEKTAKIIAITYLIYPTVMWNTLYLYYAAYLPLFAFAMIYAYLKDKKIQFYASFILCLSLKENVNLFLFPLGLFLIYDACREKYFSDRIKWYFVLPLIVLTPIVFIFAVKVFSPHFNTSGYRFIGALYSQYLNNPSLIIKQLFSGWTLIYILELLLPLSFIPLNSPIMVAAIPTFFQNILVSPNQILFTGHYSYEIIIAMFLSVIIYFKKNGAQKLTRYFYLSIFWAFIFSLIKVWLTLRGGI